jgi:hypothetical protein
MYMLLHEKKARALEKGVGVELREILKKIPSHEYLDDLGGVRELLGRPMPRPN